MRLLSIVGARPQFIKEAMIQNEISKHPSLEGLVVHTGQHYDVNMSGIFFEVLGMRKPDYNLGIKGALHGEMTAKMIIKLEKIMIKERPDFVILYGDTNSTLAGAIAASKLNIKTAHIEAGLRQEPKHMPEEINRVVTDSISTLLFAPSQLAVNNLSREGLGQRTYLSGDVMFDVYLRMQPKFDMTLQGALGLENDNYIVLTLHRDFNVDSRDVLAGILTQANRVSKDMLVVFPVHPRTKKRIEQFELGGLLSNIKVLSPVDYLSLMGLTQNAYKVVTDSGGYQKEAFFAGKRACILMPDTAWRELTDHGFHKLVSADTLYESVFSNLGSCTIDPVYGVGNAAEKIISTLMDVGICNPD